jgi:hypothetical protein
MMTAAARTPKKIRVSSWSSLMSDTKALCDGVPDGQACEDAKRHDYDGHGFRSFWLKILI